MVVLPKSSGISLLSNRYSLLSHQVPEDWKKALVTPIFKKGDSDSLANCRHFPVSAVNYSFSLFYGLLSGLGSLLRMFCFLWLSQLGVINYIAPEILWAHNFHWVQWKADSVYFLCEKKMFKMFTVGEMATNFPHANAGNCNSTTLSKTDFASVCKTSAVSLCYIDFEITGYPCNLIGSQQCDLFLNRTIFCSKSHLFQIASFMF